MFKWRLFQLWHCWKCDDSSKCYFNGSWLTKKASLLYREHKLFFFGSTQQILNCSMVMYYLAIVREKLGNQVFQPSNTLEFHFPIPKTPLFYAIHYCYLSRDMKCTTSLTLFVYNTFTLILLHLEMPNKILRKQLCIQVLKTKNVVIRP